MGTVEKVVAKIRELGKQGVQFATFPEAVIPYYPYFSFVQPAFAMAKEHLRLLEQSVTVPSGRRGRSARRPRTPTWSSLLASMNVTAARSTIRSFSLMPTAP